MLYKSTVIIIIVDALLSCEWKVANKHNITLILNALVSK